jgi:hypothetical protein
MSDDQQDKLPCEGCPDPGMPCLGCPAQDEPQDEPDMDYEQAALALRKFMCCPAGREFVAARLIRPFRMDEEYRGEGERAATERIVRWLRERPMTCPCKRDGGEVCQFSDPMDNDELAYAIERGEHNE